MLSSLFVIVPFIAGINALNDWTVPCTSGECSYDLPASNNSASGSLKIWGSTDSITDITTAADWQILNCNSTALSQNITLVCMNDPSDPNSKCGHLYQNIGAVNKIVRLPENCGANAFARIAKSWVAEDQTIPASVRRSLFRRDGKTPVVQALAIDTNFDAVDYSKAGPVNIAIMGANVPGAPTDIQIPKSRRSRTAHRRFSIGGALGSLKDGIDNAAGDVKNAATAAAGAVKNAATAAAGDVKSVAKAAATDAKSVAKAAATDVKSVAKAAATDAKGAVTKAATAVKSAATKVESKAKSAATKVVSDAKAAATKVATAAKAAASDADAAAASLLNNTIDVSKEFDLPPLTFDKSANLFNGQVNCGDVSASLSVDMDANANANVALTVAAQGTIAPPKLTSFGVVAGMTGTVAGTMTVTADVTGHVESPQIQLANIGIPGLDFPGILTIGPSFTVSTQVVGDVDVTMDMTVGINFDVNNAQLAFPPTDSNKPLSSAFSIGNTPLTLNAAPGVTATGTLTAHLIPSLNLGVNALGGKAEAQIFLNLDTNAALQMNLDASASATKDITPPALASAEAASSASRRTDDSTDTTDDSTDDTADDETADTTDDGSDDTTDSTDDTTDDSTDESTDTTDDGSDDATDSTDDTTDDSTDDTADDTADSTDSTTPGSLTTSTSFGGCVGVNGGVDVNVGVTGDFFGLFDKTASATPFSKSFQIFQKCFGADAAGGATDSTTTTTKRFTTAKRSARRRTTLQRRVSLSCPASGTAKKVSVTKGTVEASSIKSTTA
ncbi:hypothetical protein MSAN_00769100 [Mycena sanguinolenta]|uniref:Uncharacterized protein n=1 Tax=Mycena sanguinolenta TaxID=230812 RepID=A0A8H6Z8U9_9AGAR|nr:hypothetical protein MSAN_00769100 [Mycena sanguinolenta]